MSKRLGFFLSLLIGFVSILPFWALAQAVPAAAERRLARALSVPSEAQRVRELERLAREFPGTAVENFVHGYKLARQGKAAEAEAAYRSALEKDGRFGEAQHQLGLLFFDRGDFEAAREAFERATATRPSQAVYWKNLGRALRRLREYGHAADAFRQALRLAPRDIETEKFLAFALDEAGASAEALAQYQRSIRLDPRDAGLRANQAGLLERLGRTKEAEQTYRTALEIHPHEEMAVTGLAVLLEKQNQLPLAIRLIEKIIEDHAATADTYFLLARLYEREGDRKKAAENYRQARDLDPTNAFYAWQHGQMFEASGQVEAAFEEYKRGILEHPQQPMFYSSLALLALRLRRQEEVLTWLEQLSGRNPNVAELHAWVGYLYWETQRLEEAEEHYVLAAKIDPMNREYRGMLARIRERRSPDWRWYAPLFVAAVILALHFFRRYRRSAG